MALTTTPVGNLINDMMMVPAWVLPSETTPTFTFNFNSGDLFIADNDPMQLVLPLAPIAVGDVTLTAKGFGDFEGTNNFLRGFFQYGTGPRLNVGILFSATGTDCNAGLDEDGFRISADDWNLYVRPLTATFLFFEASSPVNQNACNFNATVNVSIEYEAETENTASGPAVHDIRSAHKTLVAGNDPVQPEIIQSEMQFDHLTSSIVPVVVDRLGKTNIGGAAVCSIDMGDGTRVSFLGLPMKGETGGQIVVFSSAGSCVDL